MREAQTPISTTLDKGTLAKKRYSQARNSSANHYDVCFIITNITSFGVLDIDTKTFNCISQNPLLHPKELDKLDQTGGNHVFSGWVSFRFIVKKESNSNVGKLIPDDNGEYCGESTILPFLAPYVMYRGILRTKVKKPPPPPDNSLKAILDKKKSKREMLANDPLAKQSPTLLRTFWIFLSSPQQSYHPE